MDYGSLKALAEPDCYARVRLGFGLYPWQEKILRAMSPRGSRVAVRTCNEAGKTSTLVLALCLWHMESFLCSLTVTTSGSYRQIKDQLFPHLQNWGGRLGAGWEFGDCWGRHNGTGSRLVSFSVAERTPHDYGITAGMSVMLGLIENMASETDDESTE